MTDAMNMCNSCIAPRGTKSRTGTDPFGEKGRRVWSQVPGYAARSYWLHRALGWLEPAGSSPGNLQFHIVDVVDVVVAGRVLR